MGTEVQSNYENIAESLMKVLFVAVNVSPFKINSGANQRSSLILEACTRFADVDVISFCSEEEPDGDGYHIIYQKQASDGWCREGRMKKARRLLTPWKPETLFCVNKEIERVIDGFYNADDYDFIIVRYLSYAVCKRSLLRPAL